VEFSFPGLHLQFDFLIREAPVPELIGPDLSFCFPLHQPFPEPFKRGGPGICLFREQEIEVKKRRRHLNRKKSFPRGKAPGRRSGPGNCAGNDDLGFSQLSSQPLKLKLCGGDQNRAFDLGKRSGIPRWRKDTPFILTCPS